MEQYITMSRKELVQSKIFEQLKNKKITQVEAANKLGFSTRWVRKKLPRYLELGDRGLIHKNRNSKSPNCWCAREQQLAMECLQAEWHGFGPTFASEKLDELFQIKVSRETLRKSMIKEGLWKAGKRKKESRKRRDRRLMLGIMVQLDGSPHDWFEGRGPKCTLLVFIDDATSKILWLEFVRSESYIAVMNATKNYISQYGRPHEFYVDFGSVFSVNLNNPEREKKTEWERVVEDELGIKVIHAHSPQAKGRVERCNQTLQDRLVNEMRLAKVSSMETANQFARDIFIPKHNKMFSASPAQNGDAHRPIDLYNLDEIFCMQEERILANDYTISYNKRILQLDTKQQANIRPKDKIKIHTYLDGSIKLFIRKICLAFKEINIRPIKQVEEKKYSDPCLRRPGENSRRWASGKIGLSK